MKSPLRLVGLSCSLRRCLVLKDQSEKIISVVYMSLDRNAFSFTRLN